jgi:hypothetical protein
MQHTTTKEPDMRTHHTTGRRELDHRHVNGIDVTLSWSPVTDLLYVTVNDDASEPFELVVDAHEALDAFHHPYAYAAFRGLELVPAAAA